MLREARNVRQIAGEPRRRWFTDDYFDLIIWLEPDGSVWGFQLCYDLQYCSRALTWTKKNGYRHSGVDDGENSGAHKASPVLVADGLFDPAPMAKKFEEAAAGMPRGLADFVLRKIKGFKA